MKRSLLISFLISACFNFSFSKNISPSAYLPLIDHLIEVNAEWRHQKNVLPDLQISINFKNERERIQMHLRLVETALSKREMGHLTPAQKINRILRLQELRDYWQTGVFPKNTFHAKRQPYFIDVHGTACAVGHLMLQSGAAKTVEKIANESNFAYVQELTIYPELMEWANINGFTVDELAWIQPGYPPAEQATYAVGNGGGANGQINVMFSNNSFAPTGVVVAGDFTEIDGMATNSIATWDGENWHTYGDGVDGEIHAVALFDGGLVIGGEFTLPNMQEPANIAKWENGAWQPLQSGNMEGGIFALQGSLKDLYVGGDFKKIDGMEMPFLARFNKDTGAWSQDGEYDGEVIEDLLTVDGPVWCFTKNTAYILVGGDYSEVAAHVDHPSFQPVKTQHLAYWDTYERNWLPSTFSGGYQPVLAAAVFDGRLVVGGDFNEQNPVAYLSAGIWFHHDSFYSAIGDGIAHGFLRHNDRLILYGGFSIDPIVGIYETGISEMFYTGSYGGQIGFWMDGTVTAAASYNGNAYFAGDFTTANYEPFNGLFYSPLNGLTPTNEAMQYETEVYYSNGQLHLKNGPLADEVELDVFNLQGQRIMHTTIYPDDHSIDFPMTTIPSGIYIYHIHGGGNRKAGKFFK